MIMCIGAVRHGLHASHFWILHSWAGLRIGQRFVALSQNAGDTFCSRNSCIKRALLIRSLCFLHLEQVKVFLTISHPVHVTFAHDDANLRITYAIL